MIRVKRKIIVRVTYIFIAIIICFVIVVGLREMWQEKMVSRLPRKTFGVVIDLNQRERLFEQLKRFADAHDFNIHMGPTTPAGVTFNIYMSRKDVILIANNVLNSRGYKFAFYDKNISNPVSEEVVDNLMSDLKRFISEVPNVSVFD